MNNEKEKESKRKQVDSEQHVRLRIQQRSSSLGERGIMEKVNWRLREKVEKELGKTVYRDEKAFTKDKKSDK